MPSPYCPGVSWPSRVRREVISRLYANDALGIHDEELIDHVAHALLARCIAIGQVTDAFGNHRVHCPLCGGVFDRTGEELACPYCSWRTTWTIYHKTFRGKKLYAHTNVYIFNAFVPAFSHAQTAAEKMIAIDQLLHTFHHELRRHPTAPAAKNLLVGNIQEIVAFLDGLSYGKGTTPEVQAMREKYDRTLKRSGAGGAPKPKDWREPYMEE